MFDHKCARVGFEFDNSISLFWGFGLGYVGEGFYFEVELESCEGTKQWVVNNNGHQAEHGTLGPILLTWIIFNHNTDKQLNAQ